MQQSNPREEVLLLLVDIDRKKVMSSQGLSNLLLRHQFDSKQDRAFMTRLLEGTLEQQIYLDYVLNQFSSKKMNKQKPLIRCLLRMSLYQILFMEQVPESAACNEAVKLARKRGFRNLSGFVNGLLRNIVRKREEITLPDEKKTPYEYLSVRYSIPQWILEKWSESYDYDQVKEMAAGSIRNPETCVRVNLSKISTEEAVQALEKENVTVSQGAYLPYILKIKGYDSLGRLSLFREGALCVQDESSAMVGQIADPKKDDLVVDVCSAPGGKSLHIADLIEKQQGQGKVISRDVSQHKIDLIEENVERCGFTIIETEVFDGTEKDETLAEKANLVIADVPCSGLGILARKNDIKYNTSEERIQELVPLKRKIIENASSYVKPGGIFVFSTCTVTKEENDGNRRWILENLPFEAVDFSEQVPESLKEEAKKGYLQLLPGVHETDGFYIAKFRRI